MREFVIITDSCSDLGKDVRKRLNIEYVPMNIVYDEKELIASLDWDLYTPKELYDLMKSGKRITTNQVPVNVFMDEFEKYLKDEKDIIYIGCSSALSGSINASYVVRDELLSKYPNAKIYCIDSLNSCLGEGLMVMDAAEMRNQGKTIEEVNDFIEKNKLCYNQLCAIEDLTYLKRAGRVNASSAFFGNLFGVKPILISNKKGENFALKKIKGRKNSLDEIINIAKEVVINANEQVVAVGHADCLADALYLKERLIEEIHPKDVYVNYIGPIIGASAGPGTIAIYLRGKEVEI